MRYVLCVQYDGTDFSGYQRQERGERTVQGELERAASAIFGCETRVAASGRTDAGVHARAQICHLDGETSIPAERLCLCFNRELAPDLRVIASAAAPEGFDCTRGAKRKTYVYSAYYAPTELPLFSRYAARLQECPGISPMQAAARLFEGEHDFRAFCASGSSAKTTVRTIYRIEISEIRRGTLSIFRIYVTGNGFLYKMVRSIAGELFAIGCGKPLAPLEAALAHGDRALLAKTMPAAGLLLDRVDYGIPLFAGVNG